MADIEIPEGMDPEAATLWPPRELIDSFLGNFPLVELRPGEVVEVDDEAAQRQARLFRDVLAQYGSGVTVVTTVVDGQPVGLTCQSFVSVSLDPPLVAFLPTKQSRAFAAIKEQGNFCVNFLAADQVAISNVMASRSDDKFAEVKWSPSSTGAALIDGVVGYTDCTIETIHDAGDHWIVVGRVQDLKVSNETDPLLFFRGKYRTAGIIPEPDETDSAGTVSVVRPTLVERPVDPSDTFVPWHPGQRKRATGRHAAAEPSPIAVAAPSQEASDRPAPWRPGQRRD